MIAVEGIRVVDADGHPVVDDVSLAMQAGEHVALVGESGSGKTTLALALLGSLRAGMRLVAGAVRVAGQDVMQLDAKGLRALRRRMIAYLPQDPATSLTPTLRVAAQIAEIARDADPSSLAWRLRAVGLPDDARFQRRYPHELSGGQQQRLALARVLAGDPQVLVLDEPTTGLDVLAQSRVTSEIARIVRERDLTCVVITHDLAAAAALADRVVVMRRGSVVDQGPLTHTLSHPSHPYTAELVAAIPDPAAAATRLRAPAPVAPTPSLLEVRDLRASHGHRRRPVVAAARLSLELHAGECVALVGSSGAGKTTIARSITGRHHPDAGSIRIDGVEVDPRLRRRSLDERRRLQLIPQDPANSLNPRRRVGAAIARPLRVLHGLDRDEAAAEARRLLTLVELDPTLANRHPGELSGGERQRVAIARALAARPDVLICDEITSALDVRVQAGILDLVADLRSRLGVAVLLISHDLGVVARCADRVLILDGGETCEQGAVEDVLLHPRHRLTRALVDASSSLHSELRRRLDLSEPATKEHA